MLIHNFFTKCELLYTNTEMFKISVEDLQRLPDIGIYEQIMSYIAKYEN